MTSRASRDDVEDVIREYLHDPRAIRRIMATVDSYALPRRDIEPPPIVIEDSWCRYCGADLPPGKLFCYGGKCEREYDYYRNGATNKPGYPPRLDPLRICPICSTDMAGKNIDAVYCGKSCAGKAQRQGVRVKTAIMGES